MCNCQASELICFTNETLTFTFIIILLNTTIGIDKLIDIYGSVNNSSCSPDKAVKILNYIAKNYDGTISVYRFAENVCLDLHDDSVLDLLMLSGEI